MCGIAGVFRLSGSISPTERDAVTRMVEAQVHRGPDDSGFFRDDVVALGHRRLSIIDTSTAGRQPIADESGTIRTIFNGEIYNYKELRRQLARDHHFSSLTDPEVLVHGYEQWGLNGLLERISGMFSFALYDSRRRTLVLARDRFGIKPLYYALNSSGTAIAFASEIKALRAGGFAGCTADIEGIAGFLLFGSTPSPQTTFKAVACLPPAHYLLCSGGTWSLHRYWAPDRTPQPASRNDANELAHAIQDSVALHLNSDVPIGFFLGGGVDSTALIAIAKRVQQNICTLTVALDDDELNEAADAGEAARHFGVRPSGNSNQPERSFPRFPRLSGRHGSTHCRWVEHISHLARCPDSGAKSSALRCRRRRGIPRVSALSLVISQPSPSPARCRVTRRNALRGRSRG